MPIYEYECQECGNREEVLQKVGAPPPPNCSTCGAGPNVNSGAWFPSPLRKVVSMSSFQLKGGGWYKDGYSTPAPGGGGDE